MDQLSVLPLAHQHRLIAPPSSNQWHLFPKYRRLDRKKSSVLCWFCSRDANLSDSGGRRALVGLVFAAGMGHQVGLIAVGLNICCVAEAVSSSRRALRGAKVPESDFTILPNGLKYYDLKVGGGSKAVKGSRVAVHYVAKWRGVTFMTSRQGLGVTGGTPYGFDVGQSENGTVLKGLDLGVEGMRVGGQRLLIVPPKLAYGSKGVQEIPPDATIEFEYDDWLASQCGCPPVEEWRKQMYEATAKNRVAQPESYRDEWHDDDLVAAAHQDFKKFLSS